MKRKMKKSSMSMGNKMDKKMNGKCSGWCRCFCPCCSKCGKWLWCIILVLVALIIAFSIVKMVRHHHWHNMPAEERMERKMEWMAKKMGIDDQATMNEMANIMMTNRQEMATVMSVMHENMMAEMAEIMTPEQFARFERRMHRWRNRGQGHMMPF